MFDTPEPAVIIKNLLFAEIVRRLAVFEMKIELQSLKDGRGEFFFDIRAGEIDLDEAGVKLVSAVAVAGNVVNGVATVQVDGKISGILENDCARCLEPVERELAIGFHSEFVTEENFARAREVELSGEDLSVDVFDGSSIDVSEIVREQILLDLPEQAFCREDCKGLCPKCGENRNLIDCKCNDSETDPRWAALKDLK